MDIHNLSPEEKTAQRNVYLQYEFPQSYGISLGEWKCNRVCRMCPMYSKPPVQERFMAAEVFERACREVGSRPVSLELSAFGETFQHPRADDYLSMARKLCPSASITVATNGTLLTPERCERIVDSGIDTLQFSLDAGSAESYNWLMQASDYDEVCRNLETLVATRNRRNARHLTITTHIIGIKELSHEFDSFVRRWSGVADHATVRPYGNWAGLVDDNGVTPAQKQTIPAERYPCAWLWYATKIEPNGDVSKCFIHVTGDDNPLGNIMSRSFEDIWTGERMKRLRELHCNDRYDEIEMCGNCIVWSLFPNFWERTGNVWTAPRNRYEQIAAMKEQQMRQLLETRAPVPEPHRKANAPPAIQVNSEWITAIPVDRTIREQGVVLSEPAVGQPSPGQLAGIHLPEFPEYIALEITNVCNLACKHCNYRYGLPHYTRDRGFISRDTVEKALTEIRPFGTSVLMNYDGESLMHPEFMDYLELATGMGINNYFNTNGTLFDKKFVDRLLRFYKGTVFFSIDGNKEWFEKIRVPASYDQVLNNLKYFIAANEANGWPITVGISLCNLGQTEAERKAFLDEWLPKVDYVSMGEVNDKFGTMISDPMTIMNVKKRPVCMVPWVTCGVCHNGDVIPCSIYVTRANTTNAIFGNIWQNSIKEIWRGDAFNQFRRMVAEERYQESFCDKCERWLSQFTFPDVIEGSVKIVRNGYWTVYYNLEKSGIHFFNK